MHNYLHVSRMFHVGHVSGASSLPDVPPLVLTKTQSKPLLFLFGVLVLKVLLLLLFTRRHPWANLSSTQFVTHLQSKNEASICKWPQTLTATSASNTADKPFQLLGRRTEDYPKPAPGFGTTNHEPALDSESPRVHSLLQGPRGPSAHGLVIRGWQSGWYLCKHTHTVIWRKVRAPAAASSAATSMKKHTHTSHWSQCLVMSRYRATLFPWQRGDCQLWGRSPQGVSAGGTEGFYL